MIPTDWVVLLCWDDLHSDCNGSRNKQAQIQRRHNLLSIAGKNGFTEYSLCKSQWGTHVDSCHNTLLVGAISK